MKLKLSKEEWKSLYVMIQIMANQPVDSVKQVLLREVLGGVFKRMTNRLMNLKSENNILKLTPGQGMAVYETAKLILDYEITGNEFEFSLASRIVMELHPKKTM
ncbi:MAG: hypothetical protein JXA03_15460 [Bacteroidales bacterium]|nr:hypothetical protein [Bacteroidales bacterium]